MLYPDETINLLVQLYFSDRELDYLVLTSLLDSWRDFFFRNWSVLINPVKRSFFESHEIRLDYLQLLELPVPPSLEEFKRDIYTAPSLTLSYMSASLHLETLCYLHNRSDKLEQILANESEEDKLSWRSELSKLCSGCDLGNLLNAGKLANYMLVDATRFHRVTIRLENFTPSLPFNALRSHTVGCIVSVRGQVVRIGPAKSLILSVLFSCHKCGRCFFKKFKDGVYDVPTKCIRGGCDSKIFQILHHCVETTSFQKIRSVERWISHFIYCSIQEQATTEAQSRSNRLTEPSSNAFLDIELKGNLVDQFHPGNLLKVVGIIQATPTYSDNTPLQKSMYIIYISAISVVVLNKKSEGQTYEEHLDKRSGNSKALTDCLSNDLWKIYKKQGSNIVETSTTKDSEVYYDERDPDAEPTAVNTYRGAKNRYFEFIREIYYNEPNRFYLVASSLFPHVIGRTYVKVGLLLALLGGVSVYNDEHMLKHRGNIHCLLVGDPGVGKSLMLRSICSPLSGSYFFSGGNVTSSGLTAAVIKENGSNEFTLEAGALVLASGGVCCIDELDKIPLPEQQAFLEAMEQQFVTVAKGGIISTLNAQCTVICASNPINGKFNCKKPLSGNLRISSQLLSRFDLIFLMTDNQVDDKTDLISNHILGQSQSPAKKSGDFNLKHKIESLYNTEVLDEKLIHEYIDYAKTYIRPIFTSESKSLLKEFYCELRNLSKDSTDSLPTTTRQLEGIMRLCQARARGDLCDKITVEHVADVIEIFKHTCYYPGYINSISGSPCKREEKRQKSTNSTVSLFVSALKDILDTRAACVPNKEMIDLAKELIQIHKLNVLPDHIISQANHYGYILKQGSFWKTNL